MIKSTNICYMFVLHAPETHQIMKTQQTFAMFSKYLNDNPLLTSLAHMEYS